MPTIHSPPDASNATLLPRPLVKAAWLAAALSLWLLTPSSGGAQDIAVALSSEQGYVGLPIYLDVVVRNVRDIELPDPPSIEGCDVELYGPPRESLQTTIINGRRRTSRSIRVRFAITPQRTGEFEAPGMRIEADGRSFVTERLPFRVTESESGDLLMAEVVGSKRRVYVGEPLELALKIWIKPFRDANNDITLNESQMWQMLAEQTSWGVFADQIQELAEKRRRPRGREVLREDADGNRTRYYLYELKTDTYPKRPGKLDASDVRIVVNYPQRLSRVRDPFDEFFQGSPFGDDLFSSPFGRSPFGPRLTVEAARPVVATARVDETQVLPIPTDGRPDDYRGAVGSYRILAQASPREVRAGDPITLDIGIGGDGPMELLQAPPLAELPDLNGDFRVSDQPLAGFVQGETKMFRTTIRPRSSSVTEIPPIPLSYFDPESESFQTVYSEPIAITVSEAESLELDAIVGGGSRRDGDTATSSGAAARLQNYETAALTPQAPPSVLWRWLLLAMPPLVWLTAAAHRYRSRLKKLLPELRGAAAQCQHRIAHAESPSALLAALVRQVARRSRGRCDSAAAAAGRLRLAGRPDAAAALESFASRCERAERTFSGDSAAELDVLRTDARTLSDRIDEEFRQLRRSQVRRLHAAGRSAVLLLAILSSVVAEANAGESLHSLSKSQQQAIFAEANAEYAAGAKAAELGDAAKAAESFRLAASKYQQLVDADVRNSRLFFNLGNACLRSGETGRAIANYERARRLSPLDSRVAVNLRHAVRQAEASRPVVGESWTATATRVVDQLRRLVDPALLWLAAGLASIWFWGALTLRLYWKFPLRAVNTAPAVALVVCLGLLGACSAFARPHPAVVVVDELSLHRGSGEHFPVASSIDNAQGLIVSMLSTRAGWVELRTDDGQQGWAPPASVESIDLAGNPQRKQATEVEFARIPSA